MSLLNDNDVPARAEARTAAGWQRFDRAALTGGLGLAVLWVLLWLLSAVFDGSGPVAEPPLAQVPSAANQEIDRNDAPQARAETDTAGSETPAGGRRSTAGSGGDQASVAVPGAEDTDAARASVPAVTGEPAASGGAGVQRMADAGPGASPRALPVPRVGEAPAGDGTENSGTPASRPSGTTPSAESAGESPAAGASGAPVAVPRIPTGEPPAVAGASGDPLPAADTNDDGPATAGNPLLDRIPLRSSGPISAAGTKAEPERGADVQLALLDPILDLRATDGRLQIDGILGSDESRTALVRAALKVYGMRNLTDRLAVSAGVAPFPWSENMADLMVLLDGPESDLRVRVSGEMVTLSGEVGSLDDKLAKGLQAQQLFGTTAIIDNRLQVPSASDVQGGGAEATAAAEASGGAAGEPAPAPAESAAATTDASTRDTAATDTAAASGSDSAGGTAAASGAAEPGPVAQAPVESEEPTVPPDAEGGRQAAAGEVRADPRGAPDNFRLRECARVVTGVYITFESASARLDPRSREILDDIVPCLPRREYVVGGHTDNRGPGESNRELSRLRAEAVKAYLVSKGADAAGLEAVGHGETKPVATNNTAAGRARNRRVDFRLKG